MEQSIMLFSAGITVANYIGILMIGYRIGDYKKENAEINRKLDLLLKDENNFETQKDEQPDT